MIQRRPVEQIQRAAENLPDEGLSWVSKYGLSMKAAFLLTGAVLEAKLSTEAKIRGAPCRLKEIYDDADELAEYIAMLEYTVEKEEANL